MSPLSPANVLGPIEGGRGVAYSRSVVDLDAYGYVEEEHLVSGTASTYGPVEGAPLTTDGRWRVEARDARPYTTRILVRRPVPEAFNGTVVVEFMQEYFGTERDTNYRWNAETLLREGFAWVGASLHHEGVDKTDQPEMVYQGRTLRGGPAMRSWDPERYARLSIPHSDLCYDMLSQIGAAVGPDRPQSCDPLAGLDVQRVLAVGNTIAADRLRHYINAVHPLHSVFDGFYLQDLSASGISLEEGLQAPVDLRLRTDCDVPIIILNTMNGLLEAGPQETNENLRIWEPAGSAHTTGAFMVRTANANQRDFGVETNLGAFDNANSLPVQFVSGAAIVALQRWVHDGKPAPDFPRIPVVEHDGTRTVEFDKLGNVRGGLRTPWVDVPIARYDWRGGSAGDCGKTIPFSSEQLKRLYGTPQEYRRQFADAVEDAQHRGVLLPEDARQAILDNEKTNWRTY